MVHARNREFAGLRVSCPKKGCRDSSFIQVLWCRQATGHSLPWEWQRLTPKTVSTYHNALAQNQTALARQWLASQLPRLCWWSSPIWADQQHKASFHPLLTKPWSPTSSFQETLLLETFTQPGPSSEGRLQSSSHVGPKHLLLSDISIFEWCDVETWTHPPVSVTLHSFLTQVKDNA